MLLTGKYIVINKKEDIKPFLNFLYSNGYYWNADHKKMIKGLYEDFTKQIYISSSFNFNDKSLWWFTHKLEDKTELNIRSLLREEKLKRILK